MKEIPLSGKRGMGVSTLVDDDVYEKYGHLKWHLSDTGYAVRRSGGATTRLHRIVADTPADKLTDHLNHNRLDNRRSNLRIVTQKENMANYKGGKGYCWDASKKLWMVRWKKTFYGRYRTEVEARAAYKLASSGVPHTNQSHPRRKYLPKGVFYMQPQVLRGKPPYYIRPTINGIRKFQGFFSSVQEAEEALHKQLAQGGLTS